MPKMVKEHLQCTGHNLKDAHSYNIIDDLAQSPLAMSALEVLQTCPSQRKALISTLGAIDPSDSHLMVFNLNKATPRLPSVIAFQIPVSVQNINIHHCNVNEWASTCIMSKYVW